MNNYKLIVQYDGGGFAGWQIQKNAKTVQAVLKEKIELLLREEINLIGSGRTDTGVHALGQVANFLCDDEIETEKFLRSLNAILPKKISVLKIEKVPENFHARYDAKRRSYLYFFSLKKSPFFDDYSWLYKPIADYDLEKMNGISKTILGKHDFTSFAKTKSEAKNKICEIYSARWRRNGILIIFYIEANRFLHGMVRTVVGTLLEAYNKPEPEKFIEEILAAKDRTAASGSAKAKGLFLYKVKY